MSGMQTCGSLTEGEWQRVGLPQGCGLPVSASSAGRQSGRQAFNDGYGAIQASHIRTSVLAAAICCNGDRW